MRNYYVLLMLLVMFRLGSSHGQNENWDATHSLLQKVKNKIDQHLTKH